MALLVPIALDRNGNTVLPDCDKSEGPFECVECSESLLVRQGEKNQWHFAHATDSSCPGGESLKHLAAKLIVANYITKINLVKTCSGRLRQVHRTTAGGMHVVVWQKYRV